MNQHPSLFACRLRDLLSASGLTRAELARRTGLGRQAVSDLVSGRREPSWQTACKMADALGLGVEVFARPADAPALPGGSGALRLLEAAQAYARAYDQIEQKSRGAGEGSEKAFARFQEAQVELNLAALDLFAGSPAPPPQTKPAKSAPARRRGKA